MPANMPANIVRFEQLAYGSLAVGVVPVILFLKDHRFELLIALGFFAIFAPLWAALIWVTARRRRNWGRWIYSAISVSHCGLAAWLYPTYREILAVLDLAPNLAAEVTTAVWGIMALASVYFLFAGDAASWFRPEEAVDGSAAVRQ